MIASRMNASAGSISASSASAWPLSLRCRSLVVLIARNWRPPCQRKAGGSAVSVNPPALVSPSPDLRENARDLVAQTGDDEPHDRGRRGDHAHDEKGVLGHSLAFLPIANARERMQQACVCEGKQARQFDSPPCES